MNKKSITVAISLVIGLGLEMTNPSAYAAEVKSVSPLLKQASLKTTAANSIKHNTGITAYSRNSTAEKTDASKLMSRNTIISGASYKLVKTINRGIKTGKSTIRQPVVKQQLKSTKLLTRSPVSVTPVFSEKLNIGKSKIMNEQHLPQLRRIQEITKIAELSEQAKIINEAENGLRTFGSGERQTESLGNSFSTVHSPFKTNKTDAHATIRDLYGLGHGGIDKGFRNVAPDYSAGSSGYGMKASPRISGPGTSNASGVGIITAVANTVGDVAKNGFDGQADGPLTVTGRIVVGSLVAGFAVVSSYFAQTVYDLSQGDVSALHPLFQDTSSPEPAASPEVEPETVEGVDTNGDGVADSSPPPSDPEEVTQPSDSASKGNDGCNWNPHWGRCMTQQKTVKQRTDEMTGQRSRADGGEGTSGSVIGPAAVTDWEAVRHQGSGSRVQHNQEEGDPPPLEGLTAAMSATAN